MQERTTERCRTAILLARKEAERLDSDCLDPEHLLLGILQVEGTATRILRTLEVDVLQVRQALKELLADSLSSTVPIGELPYSMLSRRVIERAEEAARHRGEGVIGTGHLLLGLVKDQGGRVGQVLLRLGLNPDEIRDRVLEDLGRQTERRTIERALLKPDPKANSFLLWLRRRSARSIEPRPSLEDRLRKVLEENPRVALVGPEGSGKTTLLGGLAGGAPFDFASLDFRILDPFLDAHPLTLLSPGTIGYLPEGELLTASRTFRPGLQLPGVTTTDRLVIEFRDRGLEAFTMRFPAFAAPFVRFEVPAPDPAESEAHLASARKRIQETFGLQVSDELLGQAGSWIQQSLPGGVRLWKIIQVLWGAAAFERETWRVGDIDRLEKDLERDDPEGTAETREALRSHLEGLDASARRRVGSGLSLDSVRRAIAQLARGPAGS